MLTYIVRRLFQAILVLFLVSILVFFLTHLTPEGYARSVLGTRATPTAIAAFNQANGLNLSLPAQYWHLLDGYLHFQLGYSYKLTSPVGALIAERLPKTLVLAGLAIVLALVIAVPLGLFQAVHRNGAMDYALTGFAFLVYGMPTFFLGPVFILYFAVDLHWFSYEAPQGQTVQSILADPRALFLPVLTLALVTVATFSRYLRSAMMDVMTQDYIRTARAKGATRRRVVYIHGLRNAMLPIVTLLGLAVPVVVGGAFITESVFNYPGMGLLAVDAILQDDVPTLIGTVLVATVATVVGSLLADILYSVLDPRVRYS